MARGLAGRFTGAFIVISHDRTFLTRLTKSCLWLDRGHLRRAEIGFGGFEAWTEKVYEEEARAAEKLDAKLKLELHWLERGVTARRRRNQGRLAKLHEMRAQRAAMIGAAGTAKLALAKDDVRSKTVIDADACRKSFGERADHPRLHAARPARRPHRHRRAEWRGQDDPAQAADRRAAARRGQGRAGQDAVRHRHRPAAQADGAGTSACATCLRRAATGSTFAATKKHIKGYLKEFLFDPELTEAPIGSLSGGERSRLLLAREFAREANLLVLDEPTNDLDLETLDLLQEVIADYEGTVLIVSHDRDFLDRTVTVTLGLDGSGKVDIVAGGYEDWAKRYQEHSVPVPQAGGAERR